MQIQNRLQMRPELTERIKCLFCRSDCSWSGDTVSIPDTACDSDSTYHTEVEGRRKQKQVQVQARL